MIAPPTASSDSSAKWPASCSSSDQARPCRPKSSAFMPGGAAPTADATPRQSPRRRAPAPPTPAASAASRSPAALATTISPHGHKPIGLRLQRRRQLERGGENQPGGHRAHAAQRAGHLRHRAELHVQRGQHQHDDQRRGQHAGQRRQRAAPAEDGGRRTSGQVDDVRPGQHLATATASRRTAPCVSQRRRSTSSRCATASTPPKPCSASRLKATNSSVFERGARSSARHAQSAGLRRAQAHAAASRRPTRAGLSRAAHRLNADRHAPSRPAPPSSSARSR